MRGKKQEIRLCRGRSLNNEQRGVEAIFPNLPISPWLPVLPDEAKEYDEAVIVRGPLGCKKGKRRPAKQRQGKQEAVFEACAGSPREGPRIAGRVGACVRVSIWLTSRRPDDFAKSLPLAKAVLRARARPREYETIPRDFQGSFEQPCTWLRCLIQCERKSDLNEAKWTGTGDPTSTVLLIEAPSLQHKNSSTAVLAPVWLH